MKAAGPDWLVVIHDSTESLIDRTETLSHLVGNNVQPLLGHDQSATERIRAAQSKRLAIFTKPWAISSASRSIYIHQN